MNAYARALFSLAVGIASELPPFSEVALAPASHCGIGATRHLPLPDATPDSRLAGIQAPIVRVAIVPSLRPLYQPSLHDGVGVSSFSSSSVCQVSAKRFEPASARSIETLSPSTLNGWPPACQIRLVVKPASPASFAMYALGSALRI